MKKCLTLLLLLPCTSAASADNDPEPPGISAKVLNGKWHLEKRILRGTEAKAVPLTYEFDGDKYSYQSNGRLTYSGKVKIDAKSKPVTLELTRDNSKAVQRFAVKIEKGKLYLASTSKGGKADFTGNTMPLMVFEREKR